MPITWLPRRKSIEEEVVDEIIRYDATGSPRGGLPTFPEVGWRPQINRTQQAIQAEESRIAQLKESRWAPQLPTPFMASEDAFFNQLAVRQDIEKTAPPQYVLPVPKSQERLVEEAQEAQKQKAPVVEVPMWQRALQVFAAPFEWVDEHIIVPGMATLGTTMGFVPEVERKAGEDFWEWKKRSWKGWKSPGINVNVPWSDKPWRIDAQGILELAPWLLIPGAGQAGTAVRTGAGIAGVLSRAGRVGRILGTAVEYSPWGLAERTAGVAIRGGFRAVGNISERVSTAVGERLFGKYIPPPIPDSVVKLSGWFKQVVMPARRAATKKIPELRKKQEREVQRVLKDYGEGQFPIEELQGKLDIARKQAVLHEFAVSPEALAIRQGRAIGEVEARVASGEISEATGKALITKIKNNPAFVDIPFEEAEIKELADMITSSVESGLVKADSYDAFNLLMLEGQIPQPHHIRDFAKVFGEDFAKAVGQLRTIPRTKVERTLDALNIGRALVASFDVSATARQGLILSLLHPTRVPLWYGRQIKALLSEKLAFQIDDAMRADPLFKEVISHTGGYIAPIREATLAGAEELFASRAARRIPGIRRSERAFVTYLNQARYTALKDGYVAMKAQGATPEQFKLFGQFVDFASGRGKIPKSLEKFTPVLNMSLFSPRLQAATLQLPRQLGRMLISDNPYMRKEAAKALVTFVGGGVGLLSILNATGNKVEIDPRSGDFGKIKVGETRLDIWRGYLQYIRFASQLLTGERKSAYGNMNKAERSEIVSRFLQSKSSPAVGLLADLLRGETYMGQPIFSDTTGFTRAARERVIPLALQDVIDAMELNGVNGLWVAAPATHGVGALTYVNEFVRIKERIARQAGYDSWDDIDPVTRRGIENTNAELQAATIGFDRQVMGTAWGDWRLAGNAVEDVFRTNVEQAVAQYRQSTEPNKGYTFNEKVKEAFSERRGGYEAREKELRFEDIVKRLQIQDTLESLIALGPEQLGIKIYNDSLFGDDMYDEFGDYRYDEARIREQELRQKLGDEMFDYIEDYRELKFQTFPPEFQELMRAREIMRPYWEVRSRVEKLFGQRFADSSRGQVLISKMRKQKRLADPEMEAVYQRFYAGR